MSVYIAIYKYLRTLDDKGIKMKQENLSKTNPDFPCSVQMRKCVRINTQQVILATIFTDQIAQPAVSKHQEDADNRIQAYIFVT